MAGFIFGGDTGIKNPQELAAKRAIANALLAAQRAPRNVGEGLSALGDGIVAGVLNSRGDRAEAAGIESANSAFAPILAALGGGGAFPARPSAPDAMNAPVGAVERAPLPPVEDYASKRVAQAFGDKKAPATGADPIQEVMDAGGAAKNDNWLRYANQGATRNLPIDAKLQSALSFLPELGVQMEVFSGGQPGKGSGLPRVGSTRHDHGGAADVFFYKDGRKLDWANPQDVPIFQEIVRRSKAAGVTGFGAGDGYMQPGSMHIGFGAPAAWGAGGKGENAPDWLRSAYDGVTPPSNAGVQVAQALSAPAQGREPMSGQSDMPGLGTLIGAMSNPWMNENQGAIVKALLGQRMKEMDPATALERRKLEAEIKALENPQGDPFTLGEGQIRFDSQGNPIAKGGEKVPDLPSAVREYEYAKQQGFPGTFQDWESSKKGGMSLQVDPATGAVTFQQGANIKPLTEAQSKDTVYATRAQGALPLIDQYGEALTSLGESVAGQVPGVGNYMKSPEYQQAEQAGKEFLQAILRKDTGAAITTQETAEYGTVYLPRPGDSPEVLAQKKVSRQRALEAIKAGMPAQAILNQEKALQNVGEPAPDAAKKPISEMTDEELEAIINGQ